MPLRQIASRLSPRGWAVVGGSAALAVLFLVIVMRVASAPSYSTIMTGLDPAQTSKITSTLDTKGISYQIQNGGTALAVTSSQTSQARIALATAGLLGSQQPGMSLLDSQQLGASSFQQQVTYQRALEGQLGQTIQSIQGVTSAQVQLVLPNATQQLFADNSTPATAAVELSGTTSLDPGAVKGIAQLVASSVQGLSADKVTITDGSGNLLWPSAASGGLGSGSLLAKESAQQQYDQSQSAQLDAMLTQTLGPNKAQVMVNADLNANQATSAALTYAKKGVPLTQQTQNETLTGAGAAGAAGATGTIPAYAGTTTGGGNSKYANKSTTTTFGVNKVVTNTTIAPGQINRQSVSVLVDKSVPASAIAALTAAVSNAVGLVKTRGDTIAVQQIAFAKTTTPTVSTPSKMMDYAKYAGIGLGALVFLVFVTRQLRRREHEALTAQPTWLRELESPRPLAALESQYGVEQESAAVKQLRSPVNVAKRQVEDLVERDPDRVAQQVRAWMAED